jgi:brefeldin A-resistance guanine nucleotide exchange factor 1
MSLTDYERNVRGLNNKADFPAAFVKDIYTAIKENEIVLAEEHGDAFMHQFASISKRCHYPFEMSNDVDYMIIKDEWKWIVCGLLYCNVL